MYVIRTSPGYELPPANPWERPIWIPGSETLCEMTARQLAWCQALPPDNWTRLRFRRVSAAYARRYVSEGGHHETPLYRGEDRHGRSRIMYARG